MFLCFCGLFYHLDALCVRFKQTTETQKHRVYNKRQSWFLFCVLFLFSTLPAFANQTIPALNTRVTDLTGTLSTTEQAELENILKAYEKQKGSQLAVLIVPSTMPETIEQYSIRVTDNWKLGRKGIDDGVLLLIAKNDRKLRIEVGRGLEGILPDVIGKRIIEDIITPYFKQGQFFPGVKAGVEAILKVVSGEQLPPVQTPQPGSSPDVVGKVFVAVGAGALLGSFFRLVIGRLPGALASSFIVFVLGGITFGWVIAFIAAMLVLFWVLLPNPPASGAYYSGPQSHRGYGGGGSSGGGFSRGGFSGGGGSFGGGGASGSW